MKINAKIILAAITLTTATSSAFAASSSDISWTFDDFDSNCEVVDNAPVQASEKAAAVVTASVGSDKYIPWGFDDFDSNCEVIDD